MDTEPEISRLIPLFYPQSTPASTAACLAQDLQDNPLTTATLATDLPTFLLHTATTKPAHTDYALSSTKLRLDTPSPHQQLGLLPPQRNFRRDVRCRICGDP